MINIKMPDKLRDAIKKVADQEARTMSDVIRQAVIKYLEDKDIDWHGGGD